MTECQIMTITQTVARCKESGYPVSAYTLRRAIKSGAVPCRVVGRTYLIAWQNVLAWLTCSDGQDNKPVHVDTGTQGIRRVAIGR